jgi:hypothetical protein
LTVRDDIEAEANRLKKHGVKFTMDPNQQGPVKLAIFFRHLRQPDPDVPAASEESLIWDSALVGFRCRKTSGRVVGNPEVEAVQGLWTKNGVTVDYPFGDTSVFTSTRLPEPEASHAPLASASASPCQRFLIDPVPENTLRFVEPTTSRRRPR